MRRDGIDRAGKELHGFNCLVGGWSPWPAREAGRAQIGHEANTGTPTRFIHVISRVFAEQIYGKIILDSNKYSTELKKIKLVSLSAVSIRSKIHLRISLSCSAALAEVLRCRSSASSALCLISPLLRGQLPAWNRGFASHDSAVWASRGRSLGKQI